MFSKNGGSDAAGSGPLARTGGTTAARPRLSLAAAFVTLLVVGASLLQSTGAAAQEVTGEWALLGRSELAAGLTTPAKAVHRPAGLDGRIPAGERALLGRQAAMASRPTGEAGREAALPPVSIDGARALLGVASERHRQGRKPSMETAKGVAPATP